MFFGGLTAVKVALKELDKLKVKMFLQGLYQQKGLNANSVHEISKMQAAGNFKNISGVVVFCARLLFYTIHFTFFFP